MQEIQDFKDSLIRQFDIDGEQLSDGVRHKHAMRIGITADGAFSFPTREHGIFQIFKQKSGSLVVVTILEPLLWAKHFSVKRYIWRAIDPVKLSEAIDFVNAPKNAPAVLFVALTNLFYHIPLETIDSARVKNTRASMAELYRSAGFEMLSRPSAKRPKKCNRAAKKQPTESKEEPPPDDFTPEDRAALLKEIYVRLGISIGPIFPKFDSNIRATMNCFDDPIGGRTPPIEPNERTDIVLNVDYFSDDRRHRRTYYEASGRYSQLLAKNERVFVYPSDQNIQQYLRSPIKLVPADFSLVATSYRARRPAHVSWQDCAKIFSIYSWLGAISKRSNAGQQLISRRLCAEYNASMLGYSPCVKLITYLNGVDQVLFVDWHLQEDERLLDAFTGERGLVAWPFLLGKLWPGIQCNMTMRRLLGCHTLPRKLEILPPAQKTPIGENEEEGEKKEGETKAETEVEKAVTVSHEWGREQDGEQEPTLYLSVSQTKIKCFDMRGQAASFDIAAFFEANEVFCDYPIFNDTKEEELHAPWHITFDAERTRLVLSSLVLSSQGRSTIDPIKAFDTIISHILYQCGGLRRRVELNLVDYERCSVYCFPRTVGAPLPTFALADDLTPRTGQVKSLLASEETRCLAGDEVERNCMADGLRIDVEFDCVYDVTISHRSPVVVHVYLFEKENRNVPTELFKGVSPTPAPTIIIRPGPGGEFELHCEATKTCVLVFDVDEPSPEKKYIGVQFYMRPYASAKNIE